MTTRPREAERDTWRETFFTPDTVKEPNVRREDWISLVYWLLKSIDLTCDLTATCSFSLRPSDHGDGRDESGTVTSVRDCWEDGKAHSFMRTLNLKEGRCAESIMVQRLKPLT